MEENVENAQAQGTAAPEAGRPSKQHNWTLIALVAVSILAVLLLASTIVMAVAGDFPCHNGKAGWERQGRQGMGHMQGEGNQWRRQQRPFPPMNPPVNPDDQAQQNQAPRDRLPRNQQQPQSTDQSQ
jgi:hypothetical protein